MIRTLLLGLLGLAAAVGVGLGVHLLTRDTIALPVVQLERPALAPPATTTGTTTTARGTTAARTTTATVRPPGTATFDTTSVTETDDGSGRNRGRGRGRGGSGGGEDD